MYACKEEKEKKANSRRRGKLSEVLETEEEGGNKKEGEEQSRRRNGQIDRSGPLVASVVAAIGNPPACEASLVIPRLASSN